MEQNKINPTIVLLRLSSKMPFVSLSVIGSTKLLGGMLLNYVASLLMLMVILLSFIKAMVNLRGNVQRAQSKITLYLVYSIAWLFTQSYGQRFNQIKEKIPRLRYRHSWDSFYWWLYFIWRPWIYTEEFWHLYQWIPKVELEIQPSKTINLLANSNLDSNAKTKIFY